MASPVTEAAQRIFADLADPQAVNRDADGAWKAPLWRALEEAGLTLAWVPEALGGAGARLTEGFEVLAAAGRYALAAPLAETLLAGWLLARGGLTAPPGMMSLAPVQPGEPIQLEPDGSLRGRARAVCSRGGALRGARARRDRRARRAGRSARLQGGRGEKPRWRPTWKFGF